MLKIETAFNAAVYREKSRLFFDSVWDNSIKKRKKSLYIALFMLLFGIAIIIGKSNLGYVFVTMGILLLIAGYRMNHDHKVREKKYYDLVESKIKEETEGKIGIWEIDDDYLHYHTPESDIKLPWRNFSSYKIIDHTLFIYTDIGISFMVSRKEIGTQNFEAFETSLESKIKKPAN
jgi:hypothetical protein